MSAIMDYSNSIIHKLLIRKRPLSQQETEFVYAALRVQGRHLTRLWTLADNAWDRKQFTIEYPEVAAQLNAITQESDDA